MARNQLILSAFFFNPQGDHRMSWRHPRAPGREVLSFDYYRELVQAAERARIDTIFVADHVSIWDSVKSGVAPLQSELPEQPARQWKSCGSQIGCAAPQSEFERHCTHW